MKKVFLYLFIIFIIGCTSKKPEIHKSNDILSGVKIPADLHAKGQLKLSSIADCVSYTILETSNQCLISEIKEIHQNGDKLFVRSTNEELFCFSKSGEFLNKIGRKGKGPQEYYSLIDYTIDNNNLYILDYNRRIAVYTHEGKFKGYIKIPKQASRIMLLTNNNIACYIPDSQFKLKENVYKWLIIDNHGDSVSVINTPRLRNNSEENKYLSNHFVLKNITSRHLFSFKEAFNDSLYLIDPSSLKIKSFGHIDEGIHKINFESTFEQAAHAKHNMRINNIIDIPGYIFISYKCMCYGNNTTHHGVYDKRERLFFNLNDQNGEEKIVNDLNPGLNFNLLSPIHQNQLVGSINAYIAVKNKNSFSPAIHIKDTDNPIIIYITIKNTINK